MKHIEKGRTPAALTQWLRRQGGLNSSYSDLPGEVKKAVHDKLLQEQGWICGYTGIRVGQDTSHIEDIYPQTMCRREAPSRKLAGARRDVDYQNLVAAFPKDDLTWRDRYPFGAKTRGDWYDEANFVHPLRPDCETQFKYNLDGRIEPADGDVNGPAAQTISHLALGDAQGEDVLSELRKAAIDEFLFDDGTPVSAAQLQQMKAYVYQRDNQGRFIAFCFVLNQACRELLRRADRERVRREATRGQQRRK